MEDTESRKSDLDIEGFSLIDVSSEDDCLLHCPFGDPLNYRFSENQRESRIFEFLDTMHGENEGTSVSSFDEREQVLEQHESPEPETAMRNGKYNLRKSLAWDNAFFTSAGFLDAEELSSMMEGNEKGKKKALPGIEEDMCRSPDSVSTLGSDKWTVESLEAGLFEDIRASIQKSSNGSNINGKRESGVTQTTTTPSSNKTDLSCNKIKPKVTPNKPSLGIQGSGRTLKQVPVHPQVPQPVATRGELTATALKPPKVLGRVSPVSTTSKRASLDVNRVKMEKDVKSAPVAGKGAPISRKPALSSGRNILPRPTPTSRSSVRSSAAIKTELTTSCSSLDSCSSSTSGVSKSSSNSIKKKNNPRSANPSLSSSSARNPPRVAPRSTSHPKNSHLSTYLMSMAKLPSNISPASSISEWSSESSTTSTVNQRANSSIASLETSSCDMLSVDDDIPQILKSQNHSNDKSVGNDAQTIESAGESVKRVLLGTGGVSQRTSMKPSGLRMPSPKLGFFDGVKSVVRTSNGNMQPRPGVPSGLRKLGSGSVSPNRCSTITTPAKLQSPRTLLSIRGRKPDGQQTTLSMKPRSPLSRQESSNSTMKFSSASRNVKSSPGSSPKVQNRMSPRASGEKCLKAEGEESKRGDKRINHSGSGLGEKCNALASVNDKVTLESLGIANVKDTKMTPVNGDLEPEPAGNSCSFSGVEMKFLSPKVGDNGNDKGKVHFEDEVDKLTRQVGDMDFTDIEIEKGVTSNSPSLTCDQKDQVLHGPSKPTVTLSPTALDSMDQMSIRVDSFGNSGALLDLPTGSTVVEVRKNATLSFRENVLTD